MIIDWQNVDPELTYTLDTQSIIADGYPYNINKGDYRLAECVASSFLYEGLFGNERAVELANEGFWKFVKDRIHASINDKWDPTRYWTFFGNETTIAAFLTGVEHR